MSEDIEVSPIGLKNAFRRGEVGSWRLTCLFNLGEDVGRTWEIENSWGVTLEPTISPTLLNKSLDVSGDIGVATNHLMRYTFHSLANPNPTI